VAAGFATAAVKARIVDHTVLRATAYGVAVSGFVDSREERERSDRIVLRLAGMEGAPDLAPTIADMQARRSQPASHRSGVEPTRHPARGVGEWQAWSVSQLWRGCEALLATLSAVCYCPAQTDSQRLECQRKASRPN
jgi:hypothetical protein